MKKKILPVIVAIICLFGAPLLGAYISGDLVKNYLSFPPVSIFEQVDPAPFSWFAFIIILLLIIVVMTPFLIRVLSSQKNLPVSDNEKYRFPGWGWAGLIILLAGWVIAWTRFPWFSGFQTHTFTIPWIGYIILINAFTFMRSGRSMITHHSGYLVRLFIFSAVFWWYFEFLNQFVRNWYYVNEDTLNRTEYFLFATLPFATVLPAVTGTRDLLSTFPSLSAGLDDFIKVRLRHPRRTGYVGGVAAVIGLALIGVWPDYMFPMLWIGPLVLLAAIVLVSRGGKVLSDLSRGDWRNIYLLALAALICGFFWEMWNYYSLTRWEYAVPLVDRFRIFEMPVLGYAGYLPFGLQCGLAAWLVKQSRS
jgi:hypothetical protein